MLTNFKVPFFQPKIDVEGIFQWFRDFMGRWSGSDLIKARLIDIGGVDMDATTTIVKSFGSDIAFKTIVGINVIINNDAEDTKYEASLIKDGIDEVKVDANNVTITRTVAGFFDTTDFNDTSISRGIILVWYTT